MSLLVALTANGRQAGKDTAADYIEAWAATRKLDVDRLAFADLGKQLAGLALLGVSDIGTIDELKLAGEITTELGGVENTITGRDYLIQLMNGARQLFGDDFWTMRILPRPWQSIAGLTIITDLRFPSEASRIAACGGTIIKINRDGAEGGTSGGEALETPVHHEILNDGSLKDFEQSVKVLMQHLFPA